MLYSRMVRPVLYRMGRGDPEAAHEKTLAMLTSVAEKPWMLNALSKVYASSAPTHVFGIDFPNPIGLAAGMDKDGAAVEAWPALGFGFMEIGTVTWRAQPGNPRPRLYRLPESQALVNRMGFNNEGAQALARRLGSKPRPVVPIGISLGKSKTTPLEQAVDDYVASFSTLYPFGDYFAVNVSSPNTPGLRDLQDASQLTELLTALRDENEHQSRGGRLKPILVKIAPDLTESAIGQALEVCEATGVAGVIASNTTLGRDGVAESDLDRSAQPGGLSGRPLRDITRSIVAFIHRETSGRLPVIGVGGVTDPADAAALIDAGASLVQIYTGLVYSGPGLIRKSVKAIAAGSSQGAGRASRRPTRGMPYQAQPGQAPYPTAEPPTGAYQQESPSGFGSPYQAEGSHGHEQPSYPASNPQDSGRPVNAYPHEGHQSEPSSGSYSAYESQPRSGAPSPYPQEPTPSPYPQDPTPSPYPQDQGPSPYGSRTESAPQYQQDPVPPSYGAPAEFGPSYGSQPTYGSAPASYGSQPEPGSYGPGHDPQYPASPYQPEPGHDASTYPPASGRPEPSSASYPAYESQPRSGAPSPYPQDPTPSPYPQEPSASPYGSHADQWPAYGTPPPPEPSPHDDDPYRHRGDDRRA